MLKKVLLIAAAAVGGIYLTSEEGKQARTALMKKKSTFEPIVKDLMNQMNEVLEGSKQVNSDEVRANINLLVKEAKQTLVEVDLEKTVEAIRDAIKIASKKIREASDELEKEESKSSQKLTQKIAVPVKEKTLPKIKEVKKVTKTKVAKKGK